MSQGKFNLVLGPGNDSFDAKDRVFQGEETPASVEELIDRSRYAFSNPVSVSVDYGVATENIFGTAADMIKAGVSKMPVSHILQMAFDITQTKSWLITKLSNANTGYAFWKKEVLEKYYDKAEEAGRIVSSKVFPLFKRYRDTKIVEEEKKIEQEAFAMFDQLISDKNGAIVYLLGFASDKWVMDHNRHSVVFFQKPESGKLPFHALDYVKNDDFCVITDFWTKQVAKPLATALNDVNRIIADTVEFKLKEDKYSALPTALYDLWNLFDRGVMHKKRMNIYPELTKVVLRIAAFFDRYTHSLYLT